MFGFKGGPGIAESRLHEGMTQGNLFLSWKILASNLIIFNDAITLGACWVMVSFGKAYIRPLAVPTEITVTPYFSLHLVMSH